MLEFEALCCISDVENLNYDLVSLNPLHSRLMVQSEIHLFKMYSSFLYSIYFDLKSWKEKKCMFECIVLLVAEL